ncbi:hypothetical protein GS597_17330 [Synechococcales cyanobacterium C]|uniref:DUF1795 domain-containing protein n=1 Tax=Petrachloros mirabilis ULC683 TaxID=2781853 RepID=A0A8K2A289_9CYAN|nr:hypothetical protein [Petrachloros mirabilis]NCJ08237.1 hypothetical protein [Petrachloros mirabilis ULC683]
MSRFRFSATIASLMLLVSATVPGVRAEPNSQTQHIDFEFPTGFSEPRPLGSEALGLFYPAQAPPGSEQMRITLVELDTERIEWLNMSNQELMSYLKHLFLGVNSPARSYQQRTILGQPLAGEVHLRQKPQGVSYLELYVVPLSTGHHILLAFESDTQMPLQKTEEAIQTITQSLQERPPQPRKRRSPPRRSPLDPL